MRSVLREEKKYLITTENYYSNKHFLSQVLKEDDHNNGDGYLIRSLYFDTLENTDFNDKIDGLETRRKIRLRIYDPNGKVAFLEIKQKQGNYQLKRSLPLTKEEAIRVIHEDYSVLLEKNDDLATELYGIMQGLHYVPKTVNQYLRKAYVAKENNIRITFDRDIRATETSFDIFDENLILNPVFEPNFVIFEVKYNGFLLSYIKDFIKGIDRIQTPVSKYCLGRTSTIKYVY